VGVKTWQKIKERPELMKRYLVREKVIDTIRSFFKNQGFREVFTPILVPVPSIEPNLEVFKTQLRTSKGVKRDTYLIMSPEFSIKKLLAGGVGSCFEITRCFRNEEEVSSLHNPEFTMLEWYRVGANYCDVMEDFEDLLCAIIKSVKPNTDLSKWKYQGKAFDLTKPWPRIKIADAFKKYAERDVLKVSGDDFYKIYFNEVEPKLLKLKKPYFVYDYPISQAALSKPAEDPRFAERFEVFLAGLELGNCFSELTDWREQKRRFEKDKATRKVLGKIDYPIDLDLIEALKVGPKIISGIAVGVDRLVMLAADVSTIGETLFFPGKELFDL
jgi:lysyl-tRNA synthetase class 2